MTNTYRVLVEDNFHHQNPAHRYAGPAFDTFDEAVAYCTRLVDQFLTDAYRDGMSVDRESVV